MCQMPSFLIALLPFSAYLMCFAMMTLIDKIIISAHKVAQVCGMSLCDLYEERIGYHL